jgi:hypothetical protein
MYEQDFIHDGQHDIAFAENFELSDIDVVGPKYVSWHIRFNPCSDIAWEDISNQVS